VTKILTMVAEAQDERHEKIRFDVHGTVSFEITKISRGDKFRTRPDPTLLICNLITLNS
jgi:hypothetical protein